MAGVSDTQSLADHPYTDPGDGRTECDLCGKWIHRVTHSCKRVPVTPAAWARHRERITSQAAANYAAHRGAS